MSFLSIFSQTAGAASAQAPVPPAPPAPPIPGDVRVGPSPDVIREMPPRDVHIIAPEEIERHVQAAMAQAQFPFGPHDPMPFPPELIGLVLGALTLILLMIVGYPIARALARRIDRQTVARADAALPTAEVVSRLERIEHAVETMAVEIERISEGQRFTNRLFSERARELGASRAAPATGGEP